MLYSKGNPRHTLKDKVIGRDRRARSKAIKYIKKKKKEKEYQSTVVTRVLMSWKGTGITIT